MTTTIYKYPFKADVWIVALLMPQGARVLSVDVQFGVPCLWALVEPGAPNKERRFAVLGTGVDIDAKLGVVDALRVSQGGFVGTYQLDRGAVVGHVFDLGEREP